jgi:hypothetical protein
MSSVGLLGYDTQFAQHTSGVALDAFPVNTTTKRMVFAVPAGFGSIRITNIEWVADAVLNDADGTCLVTVSARDITEGADDVLVNAQNIEGGTANVPASFTLVAETAEKEFTLDEGDFIHVSFVGNSAAIDTNGHVSVFVTYVSIPREAVGNDIKHSQFYRNL